MKRRKSLFLVGAIVVLAILLWWWVQQASEPGPLQEASRPSPQALASAVTAVRSQIHQEKRKAAVEQVLSALATPIAFYGQVVDQNGDPVPDANIGYSAADKFMASGSGYTGKSDANGMFSITEIKGVRLGVNVRKEGYYQIHNVSNGSFSYGTGPDGYFRAPPTRNAPAVFVLQKMGATEPLIQISSRTYRLPKNGTPVQVDLTTGQLSSLGNLRIEAWTEDETKDGQQHYNWRCRVSVPNGGVIEREGQFNFEAPENGYQPAVEIVMPQTEERWQPQAEREYFLKLADGRYARIQFKMIAQGNHFFRLESLLNPTPGSRNLEFDPAKVIKSQ